VPTLAHDPIALAKGSAAVGRALGAFGLTEPSSGPEAGSLRTRAVLDGDEWVFDGPKEVITNSGTPKTSVIIVAARTCGGTSASSCPPARLV